jgi:hypothetical protein
MGLEFFKAFMESPRIIRGRRLIYFTLAMINFPYYPNFVPSKLSLVILVLKLITISNKLGSCVI